MAASAALYGMTRFRVPLEPLWMVYAAALVADPRGTWRAVVDDPVRRWIAIVILPLTLIHLLWYLPVGWPGLNW